MAAMFITRNALFLRFSKSFPQVPSLSFHKPSRVFFASASNHSDWRNAAEGTRRGSADWAYDSTTKGRRDIDDMAERAKETMSEGVDSEDIKGYAHDAKEKTKDAAGSMVDKAKDGTNRAAEKAESAGEKTKEYAYDTKERAKDAAGTVVDKTREGAYETKEKAKDAAGTVADKTREGAEWTAEKTEDAAGSATDALKDVGEKAKQTAQGAWETTKDAAQKVKETVVGKDDDDDRDGGVGAAFKDEDVVELRRKAGKGYGDHSKGY